MRAIRRESACRLKEKEMTVRNVVTRSSRKFHGYFPSKKLNRMVGFESILEKEAIKIFENSAEVISYVEQPAVIRYYQNQVPKLYFPDFELILCNNEKVHVEVKPYPYLMTIKLSKKYRAILETYKLREENYHFITERELTQQFDDFYQLLNNTKISEGDSYVPF